MEAPLKYFQFESLYRQHTGLAPACVGVDAQGIIRYLDPAAPPSVACEYVAGYALPGFVNAHSHAFQYAMAGHAEQHVHTQADDFWSWREAMYTCALAISPEQLEAVATSLYAAMLRNGFTHVAEFHYLHHDPDGKPYAHRAEMAGRLVAAALKTGIKLTLIPVFYQQANFGTPIHARQRRFYSPSPEAFFRLWEDTRAMVRQHPGVSIGVSVHSLRAAAPGALREVVSAVPPGVPFHMHVAEQLREVEDCKNFLGARPLQWLLNQGILNEHFFLVHGTHLDDNEIQALPATRAAVVLCPSTEGNLGDGFFRMKEFVAFGGRWCIGTDSHIGLDPFEELRMIDYRQRLLYRRRDPLGPFPARDLVHAAITNGLAAAGHATGFLQMGTPLDAVVIQKSEQLDRCPPDHRLSTLVYSSCTRVQGTLVNGQWAARSAG